MKLIRVCLIGLGLLMIGFGFVSAVRSPDLSAFRHGLFLVAVVLVDDLLLMPIFLAVGMLVTRLVPVPARPIVQGTLIVTAAVTAVALPLILGFGRSADLPSALPRNYVGGYALVVGATWLAATVLFLYTMRRRSRHRSAQKQPAAAAPTDQQVSHPRPEMPEE